MQIDLVELASMVEQGYVRKVVHPRGHLEHDFFSRRTPEADWLGGLLAADGCVHRNLRRWSLSQSGEDGLELIKIIAGMIGYQASIHSRGTTGRDSHQISVTSPEMVADLGARYLVLPAKTRTYRWPGLTGEDARVFLRGYIDGDGCVGAYSTPQGNSFLHISFVGTPEFMSRAVGHIPGGGRLRALTNCQTVTESRWNGRHAWRLGRWLYPEPDRLPDSKKSRAFGNYAEHIAVDPPAWYLNAQLRDQVIGLLRDGVLPMRVAERTGATFQNVYRWRKEVDRGLTK